MSSNPNSPVFSSSSESLLLQDVYRILRWANSRRTLLVAAFLVAWSIFVAFTLQAPKIFQANVLVEIGTYVSLEDAAGGNLRERVLVSQAELERLVEDRFLAKLFRRGCSTSEGCLQAITRDPNQEKFLTISFVGRDPQQLEKLMGDVNAFVQSVQLNKQSFYKAKLERRREREVGVTRELEASMAQLKSKMASAKAVSDLLLLLLVSEKSSLNAQLERSKVLVEGIDFALEGTGFLPPKVQVLSSPKPQSSVTKRITTSIAAAVPALLLALLVAVCAQFVENLRNKGFASEDRVLRTT